MLDGRLGADGCELVLAANILDSGVVNPINELLHVLDVETTDLLLDDVVRLALHDLAPARAGATSNFEGALYLVRRRGP